jgi:hypothetical protein
LSSFSTSSGLLRGCFKTPFMLEGGYGKDTIPNRSHG